MSGSWDEISGGREPDHDREPRRPLLPSLSLSQWVATNRSAAAVVAVVAAALLGSGWWVWQRAHPPAAADALHVRVDPSEYLLPGAFSDQGQSDLLMLLHVDVASGLSGPVRLVGLEGGGISATETHPILGSSARFTVGARLSCDQWADGKGVRVKFLVGSGPGQAVEVPLQTGPNSPVRAQISAPCLQFATSHPLRLTVFSVSLEPSDPAVRTTWTIVNRSSRPVTLDAGSGLNLFGGEVPLAPLAATETTVIAAHGTATVFRDVAVTSCVQPALLVPTFTTVWLAGTSGGSAAPGNGVVQLALPDAFVVQLFATARDVCLGAPDLTGAKVTLSLRAGPPGKGLARLTVTGTVDRPGPWTAQLGALDRFDSELAQPSGRPVQRLQGPGPFALSAGWTIGTCTPPVTTSADYTERLTVTVSGLRTYPYVLPVHITGRSGCTPSDLGA